MAESVGIGRPGNQVSGISGVIIVNLRIDFTRRNNNREIRMTQVSGSWSHGNNSAMTAQNLTVIAQGVGPYGMTGDLMPGTQLGSQRSWFRTTPNHWGWIYNNPQLWTNRIGASLEITYVVGSAQGAVTRTNRITNNVLGSFVFGK